MREDLTTGALVVLDPLSGEARRILVHGGVAGGALAVSPDGRTVYFAARHGCLGEIESVPVTGGRPRMIMPGTRPAVSPDGKKLAFARQPGTPSGQFVRQWASASRTGTIPASARTRPAAGCSACPGLTCSCPWGEPRRSS